MRHQRRNPCLAGFAIAAWVFCGPGSAAVAESRVLVVTGSNCQATDAANAGADVRFDANGVRNVSASRGAFVVCPLAVQQANAKIPPIKGIAAFFDSLDGRARDITCTAVVGAMQNTPLRYSTKTVRTPANTTRFAKLQWFTGDFGGSEDVPRPIPGSAFVTVTCNLPPKTLVNYLTAAYRLDFDP